jgi:hypothetical protein
MFFQTEITKYFLIIQLLLQLLEKKKILTLIYHSFNFFTIRNTKKIQIGFI